MDNRRYAFSWDLLGDIELGRPHLGSTIRLELYRLMQFTLRDVLESEIGTEKTDEAFFRAGTIAGRAFYTYLIGSVPDFPTFVKKVQETFQSLGAGLLRVEKADLEKGVFILTVEEDLDCSGLPVGGFDACKYDEGFIAALMESYTGGQFHVKEIDCWCTGARICRFSAEVIS